MYIFHIRRPSFPYLRKRRSGFGYENTLFAGTNRGAVESFIGEDADSEWLIWILNDQT